MSRKSNPVARLTALLVLMANGDFAEAEHRDPNYCGFWERDLDRSTQYSLSIGQHGYSHLTLRFQIDRVTSYEGEPVQLARPMWLYLSSEPDNPPLRAIHLAQVAFRDRAGRPIFIEELRLRCDPSVGLAARLGRYDQATIYRSGQGVSFPFLDRTTQPRCVEALRGSGVVDLFLTPMGRTEPSIRVRARLPIGQQARLALAIWRRELQRARSGRCTIRPPMPPPT